MMADDQLLNGVDGGDDIFVYTGGEQRLPRDVKRVRIAENVDTILAMAFYQCKQLIEVEGHNRLKKIDQWGIQWLHSFEESDKYARRQRNRRVRFQQLPRPE